MRTSFHHQPEAQRTLIFSYPQAHRPITPSFGIVGVCDCQEGLNNAMLAKHCSSSVAPW